MNEKKDRKSMIFVCSVLFVSVLSLTLAYAALSTSLKISGSAKINSATWNINISAGNDFVTYGEAKFGYPTIDSTSIKDMKIDLYKPGDGVRFPFTVRNDGSLDASLKSIFRNTITCNSVNIEDAKKVCDNITYTIKYENGKEILEGDILSSGGVQFFVLEVIYNPNSEFVSSSKVDVDGIDVSLLYEQKTS